MQRRHFLAAFSVSAAGLTLSRPAAALTLEPMPEHLRRSAPAANGAIDWDLLAQAGETQLRDGEISRFPASLRALDKTEVRLAGYMMPFREGDHGGVDGQRRLRHLHDQRSHPAGGRPRRPPGDLCRRPRAAARPAGLAGRRRLAALLPAG